MSSNGLGGLAVTSHNAGQTVTATFTCVDIGPAIVTVDFDNNSYSQYASDQGSTNTNTISGNGSTLQMTGNGWSKINLGYNVTANTILEFDFKSTIQGEIQGIGFDNDNIVGNNNPPNIFRLYGTQAYGRVDYNDYSGNDWKHYTINVGQFYAGLMTCLTFANDDDAYNLAVSLFRNIRIYET